MAITRRQKRSLELPIKEKILGKKIKKDISQEDMIETKEELDVVLSSPLKRPNLKKKVAKLYLEDVLSHIEIPYDFKLPQDFINYHTADFITGVTSIIEKDPSLYPVIVHRSFVQFKNEESKSEAEDDIILRYWYALISSIISQQISGSAARSIEAKFKKLFDGTPTPEKALKKSIEELRGAGLSNMKVKYVYHISEVFCDLNSNLTKPEFYINSPLDQILEELTVLKGIGIWSAKMFAIFTLGKMDVFAHDDLGIARGMARYLSRRKEILDEAKVVLSEDDEMKKLLKKKSKFENTKSSKRDWVPIHDEYVKYVASKFSPYQSVFMMVLWRLSSTNLEVLENTGIRD